MKHSPPAPRRSILGCSFSLVLGVAFLSPCLVWSAPIRLRLAKIATEATNVPVSTTIVLPAELAGVPLAEIAAKVRSASAGAEPVTGQLAKSADGSVELWWIAPHVNAGQTAEWTVELIRRESAGPAFRWQDVEGEHLDLLLGDRKVVRYMYARDTSTPERAHETYKPYLHVFDAEGKDTITKGHGGRYTHHRGIFFGYSRLGYDDGKRGDWWHMKNVTQEHREFVDQVAGPVFARFTSLIHWNDGEGKPVSIEERTFTVFAQPSPAIALIYCHSELKPGRGPIELNGDPEHAGFQFRAHNDVQDKETLYVFPGTVPPPVNAGKLKSHKDLPWAAMSYSMPSGRFSVLHMSHPGNPKGMVYSAYRTYGRFGAFFTRKLAAEETLKTNYGFWILSGDIPPSDQLDSQHAVFVSPLTATPIQ